MAKIMNFFKKEEERKLVVEYIYECANNSRHSLAHKRALRNLARKVQGFADDVLHTELFTDSFTEVISNEFVHYLKSLGLLSTTVEVTKDRLCTILRKAAKEGYKTISEELSLIRVKIDEPQAIYLSIQEIRKILDLKLQKEISQIRDIFVVGCCTGFRISDYKTLSEDNFTVGYISKKTIKTGENVIIPIHPFVHEIIERNNGYDFLKYKKSVQNFNKVVKTIAKKAKINDDVLIERTVGFKVVKIKYKKWELVSSHTARRSAATNMYLAGIQVANIMLITGHRTETAFFRYIRIGKSENAKTLAEHPFFKTNV